MKVRWRQILYCLQSVQIFLLEKHFKIQYEHIDATLLMWAIRKDHFESFDIETPKSLTLAHVGITLFEIKYWLFWILHLRLVERCTRFEEASDNCQFCRQRGRKGKGVVFMTTPIVWSGFNPHSGHVVASLDGVLYDDYLCLVASSKQQIYMERSQMSTGKLGKWSTPKWVRIRPK